MISRIFSTFTLKYRSMALLRLNLIAACDTKLGIGVKNELPWRLKNEMAYFNRMTTGVSKDAGSTSGESKKNVVVMGRKTWESIPVKFRPLKGRINIVLSRSMPAEQVQRDDDVIWTASWDETIEKLVNMDDKGEIGTIWITGGSYIYKLALESQYCHRIFLTKIQGDYGCDVFFPSFNQDVFRLVQDPEVPDAEQEENGVKYNFFVYEKAN